jgi:hypothetical protein
LKNPVLHVLLVALDCLALLTFHGSESTSASRPKALKWRMICPEKIDFETVHNNALRDHEESLNAARNGVTREHMQRDTVDKAVAVQNAYDALTGHIKGCPICQEN